MLELIQGELLSKGMNHVIIKVGGLGYRLQVSSQTLEGLPPLQQEVTLFTYLHVREDDLSLFGFRQAEEREVFTTLLSVSGIGPKLALSILSSLRVGDLKRVILLGDSRALVGIPGVGKKTAERIILELKDKLGKLEPAEHIPPERGTAQADARTEAVTALLALGYSPYEAQKAVPYPAEDKTVEELLRMALRVLAKY